MRRIYYGLIIGFALIILMWTCMKSVFGGMCGNQIITERLSPDKNYKFVVFVRDCGATTGFYTHVSILKSDKMLRDDDTGNVLTLNDHYYGDFVNKYGGADARVKWISSKKLLIQFDGKAQGKVKENKVKGIEINYEEIR